MATTARSVPDPELRRWWAALTLAGGLVRFGLLLTATPRIDEAYTHVKFVTTTWGQALSDYSLPNNHILHSLLARAVHVVTAADLHATRLPAFIAGTLLIPATGILAHRLTGDRRVAVLTSAIVALLPQLVRYGADARGYSMVALFTVLLVAVANELIDAEDRRVRLWVAWVVIGIAGAFTVPVFLYPVVAVTGWLALLRLLSGRLDARFVSEAAGSGAVLGVGALLAYLPAIRNSGLEALIANRFVQSMDFNAWWGGLTAYVADSARWAGDGMPAAVAIALVMALGLGLVMPNVPTRLRLLFPVVMLLSLVAMGVQRVHPFERVWSFLLPVAALTAAVGFARLGRRIVPGTRTSAGLLGLAFVLLGVQVVDVDSRLRADEPSPDFHRVVAFVEEEYPQGVRMVTDPADRSLLRYASEQNPSLQLEGTGEVLVWVNHRLGRFSLEELVARAELSAESLQLVARMPHTSLYASVSPAEDPDAQQP